jgi:hypothetical protein
MAGGENKQRKSEIEKQKVDYTWPGVKNNASNVTVLQS